MWIISNGSFLPEIDSRGEIFLFYIFLKFLSFVRNGDEISSSLFLFVDREIGM